EFFHLVGRSSPDNDPANFCALRSILAEGCVKYRGCLPGQSATTVEIDLSKSLTSGDLVNPRMTCYCDIPFDDLWFHARKYGRFGLSFHRDFLIRHGARPVMYVPMRADDRSSPYGATF